MTKAYLGPQKISSESLYLENMFGVVSALSVKPKSDGPARPTKASRRILPLINNSVLFDALKFSLKIT